MSFASEEHAHGFCDRCGWRYPLEELRSERSNGVDLHNRVCPVCWDRDHPQNFLWRVRTEDPISLRDPRPEPSLDDSRRISAWNPVGQVTTSTVYVKLGNVTVET